MHLLKKLESLRILSACSTHDLFYAGNANSGKCQISPDRTKLRIPKAVGDNVLCRLNNLAETDHARQVERISCPQVQVTVLRFSHHTAAMVRGLPALNLLAAFDRARQKAAPAMTYPIRLRLICLSSRICTSPLGIPLSTAGSLNQRFQVFLAAVLIRY